MGIQVGKLVSCDRCGEKIFLKQLLTSYEDLPGAWKNVTFSVLHADSPAYYTLCPDCSKLFMECRNEFFKIKE